MSPVNQNSFLSGLARGNGLPLTLKSRGRTETLRSRITGIRHTSRRDRPRALQLMLIKSREAPRKAKMKAWKRYLMD